MSPEEIAALPPATDDVDDLPMSEPQPAAGAAQPPDEQAQIVQLRAPLPTPPVDIQRSEPQSETPEAAAERERRYRETFGLDEPRPRRRWRR